MSYDDDFDRADAEQRAADEGSELAGRIRHRMAELNMPVGSDHPTLIALGAPSLIPTQQRRPTMKWQDRLRRQHTVIALARLGCKIERPSAESRGDKPWDYVYPTDTLEAIRTLLLQAVQS
jgi:hypothetical protein